MKEMLHNKKDLIKGSIDTFNRWSMVLFACAILLFICSQFFKTGIFSVLSGDLIKNVLPILGTISGVALQGLKASRKIKITELDFAEKQVDNYDNLKDFEKRFLEKVLDIKL